MDKPEVTWCELCLLPDDQPKEVVIFRGDQPELWHEVCLMICEDNEIAVVLDPIHRIWYVE